MVPCCEPVKVQGPKRLCLRLGCYCRVCAAESKEPRGMHETPLIRVFGNKSKKADFVLVFLA